MKYPKIIFVVSALSFELFGGIVSIRIPAEYFSKLKELAFKTTINNKIKPYESIVKPFIAHFRTDELYIARLGQTNNSDFSFNSNADVDQIVNMLRYKQMEHHEICWSKMEFETALLARIAFRKMSELSKTKDSELELNQISALR